MEEFNYQKELMDHSYKFGTPPDEQNDTNMQKIMPRQTSPAYDDPDMQRLYEQDPETAERINNVWKAQNLEGALASAKDEQDRETNIKKRAANSAKILALGNLVGQLGKFGAVATHPNGTDMPYNDISAGALREAKEARAREDAARKNYLNMQQRIDSSRAALIQQGYQAADRRKAQEEANKLAWQKAKNDYELKQQEAARKAAADEEAGRRWQATYDQNERKMAQQAAQQKAAQAIQWYNAKTSRINSERKGGNSSTVSLTYNDGNSSYDLPKNKWTVHQKMQAWDAVDPNDREEILKSLAMNIGEIDDPEAASELNSAIASFGKSNNKAASTKNINEKVLDMALATAMNGDEIQYSKLHKYMRTLTGAKTEDTSGLLDLPTGKKAATNNNGAGAVSNTKSGSAFGSPK